MGDYVSYNYAIQDCLNSKVFGGGTFDLCIKQGFWQIVVFESQFQGKFLVPSLKSEFLSGARKGVLSELQDLSMKFNTNTQFHFPP